MLAAEGVNVSHTRLVGAGLSNFFPHNDNDLAIFQSPRSGVSYIWVACPVLDFIN